MQRDCGATIEPSWRIGIYIRLSREDGKSESDSVVNQKKILSEYLERFFLQKHIVVGYYIDDGLSGTDDMRQEFVHLLNDIEKGRVNCVLVKTLSRAFRNYSDQGYYLESYFPQKNVRFICIGDPKIDTYQNPEAISGLEVPITGLMNDRFAAKTSGDVRRTFATKRRSGEFIGAFAPYGYKKSPDNKNLLLIDEEAAAVKRQMMEWVLQGISLSGVAKKLNELGIPNPTAYKRSKGQRYNNPHQFGLGLWSGTTVKRTLLDEVNIGNMVQGKQRVVSYKVHDRVSVPRGEWVVKENTHQPIFNAQEFASLREILQRNTRAPNGTNEVHLFAGLLRCADCKMAMQRRTAKGKTYYVCRTNREKSAQICTKHTIRLDYLQNAVQKAIESQIVLIDCTSRLENFLNCDSDYAGFLEILARKLREVERIQGVSDELYVDWKTGEISREDYGRLKEGFLQKISRLNSEIANLKTQQAVRTAQNTAQIAELQEFLRSKKLSMDRRILVALIDTVFVHNNNRITIKFRFPNPLSKKSP